MQKNSGNTTLGKQAIPDFGFEARVWRNHCKNPAQIPAGYSYLCQLMGHDIGNTVDVASVPKAASEPGEGPLGNRINLIDHPLTLETIYGKGPVGTPHVFHSHNCLFRIAKGETSAQTVVFSPDELPEPLLADKRNRDTMMLHKMAVLWMQYHNKIARALMANDGFTEHSHAQRAYFFEVFLQARRIVLKAWHAVLLEDLLATIAHPAAMALPELELESIILLDDIPMLNGVFRAFHALPLSSYRLNAGQVSPFGELRAGKVGERKNWRLDWRYFFGEAASNKTGFSASYSHLFTVLSGRLIMHADLASAIAALPYDQIHADVIAAHSLLPPSLKRDISAQNLERLFNQAATGLGLAPLPDGAFSHLPLFLLLLLEAQFFGENGSLGPFGSVLLRRFLLDKTSRIQAGMGEAPATLPTHTKIQNIISFVQHT